MRAAALPVPCSAYQHGNVILRQLANYGFDGAHAGAHALEPDTSTTVLRRSSSCQDFGSVKTHTISLRYFATQDQWGRRPGQRIIQSRAHALPIRSKCFRGHWNNI